MHKWTRVLLPNLQFCETGRELSHPSSISPRYIIRLCQTDIHQPQRLEGNPVRTHLKQRTRPSKKLINITDAKRYINTVTIAKDGPPITKRDAPYMPVAKMHCGTASSTKRLIITVLHLQLNHPQVEPVEGALVEGGSSSLFIRSRYR